MGVGEGDDRNGREKDRKRQEREKEREVGMGERRIERETGAGERKRGRDGREKDTKRDRSGRERDRQRDRGEREKITNTKTFIEFYLVVLHSAERSEARQWIVARQVSCYHPLLCFNLVTNFSDPLAWSNP